MCDLKIPLKQIAQAIHSQLQEALLSDMKINHKINVVSKMRRSLFRMKYSWKIKLIQKGAIDRMLNFIYTNFEKSLRPSSIVIEELSDDKPLEPQKKKPQPQEK